MSGQRLDQLLPLPPRLHRSVVAQVAGVLQSLRSQGTTHTNLRPSSFVLLGETIHLADDAHIRTGAIRREHLFRFAHACEPHATRADRLRVWRAICPDDAPPADPRKLRRYAHDLRRDAIAPIRIGAYRGLFRTRAVEPLAFSLASRLEIGEDDWRREWPLLFERVESDQLDILKRDRSGDVLAGEVTLRGAPVSVIVKRPRNKFWYRYLLDAFRMSRAKRLWEKTRWLQVRHIPVEYPLLVMEKRSLGYVVDAIAIFERVPGESLDAIDLDTIANREDFFRACGRTLRRIEDTGLTHTDAKSSNWICFTADSSRRTAPVLIDAYGIRRLNAFLQLFGIHRLLRAMKQHPQYTRADSLHLCQGFAPRATHAVQEERK